MNEWITDLFSHEGEKAVLAIPVTVAFKHAGDLVMGKGHQKKAAEWYPNLPVKLGRWFREHSREVYFASMENVLAFPIKLRTKEIASHKFVEYSFNKIKTHLEHGLYNISVYIPVNDPIYDEVDALSIARETFKDFHNVTIVRDIQL